MELLVVIGIIAVLVAILFPALSKARERAQQVACLTNIRQFYIACSSYAADYREYPNTGRVTTWADLNITGGGTLGEHAGYMGNAGDVIQPLLLNGRYTTEAGLKCNTDVVAGSGWWYGALATKAWYNYAGPGAFSTFTAQYGHNSGLTWRSQFYPHWGAPDPLATDPHSWGCSVHTRWMRLMAVCPTIDVQPSNAAFEPHGFHPACIVPGSGAQGSESWFLRRRNALYNDGHAEYWNQDAPPTAADYR